MRALVFTCLFTLACSSASDDAFTELDPGPLVGKEDSAGIASLPVDGDYRSTEAWKVTNQWEDTNTADVRRHHAVLALERRAQALPRRESAARQVGQHVDERRRGELDQRHRLRPDRRAHRSIREAARRS